MDRLPYAYAAILLVEVIGLSWLYLTNAPSSSDPFSINLGWLGLGSMVVLLVYSVARRSRTLKRFARLSYWLHFHIFLAVQGCVAVLFHCWHLFGRETPINLLNPAALSGAFTVVIFCSGLFGRYLYSTLPRTIGGVQMAAAEVDEELKKSASELGPEARAALAESGVAPSGFIGLIGADLEARRALRSLASLSLPREQLELAQRRMKLLRRRAALQVSERIFRRWIVLHRPLAAILYVVAIVHVAFSYMFSSALAG